MSKPAYNTNDIAKQAILEVDRVGNVIRWIEEILGKSYGITDDEIKAENFEKFWGKFPGEDFYGVRTGVDLCHIINKIKPGTINEKHIKKQQNAFFCRTNIQLFSDSCQKLGVNKLDCLASRDLYDGDNLPKFIDTIYALDRVTGNRIPGNNAKYATKNVRQFDAATLAKSKSAVPQMAKGGIYQKTNNQDGYGIVKTDKSMQKPSQVQSVWAKGAKKVDNKGMDGYGIVKTDKSMQNPSQVQSAWQKGSFKVDNKGMDGYGIVKTDKSMQNPSQVQGVWAQGAKKVENNNMDGYGIVKTDKSMQNPSQVQGAWQQGANKVENSGMDGYGIVKVDESMQNPSQAQGAWQQGANPNENSGMDSYGIVKQSQD